MDGGSALGGDSGLGDPLSPCPSPSPLPELPVLASTTELLQLEQECGVGLPSLGGSGKAQGPSSTAH